MIETAKGWKTLGELPKRHPDWNEFDDDGSGLGGSAPLNGAVVGPNDPFMVGPMPVIIMPLAPPEDTKPYSNAQFAFIRPQEELAVIVSSYVELKAEGDTITGTLSNLGAQLLLVHDEQNIEPIAAAGIFNVKLKNGAVDHYAFRLEGLLRVDKKRVRVHQTSNTVIKNIGRTSFELPNEARQKLQLWQ